MTHRLDEKAKRRPRTEAQNPDRATADDDDEWSAPACSIRSRPKIACSSRHALPRLLFAAPKVRPRWPQGVNASAWKSNLAGQQKIRSQCSNAKRAGQPDQFVIASPLAWRGELYYISFARIEYKQPA